MYPSSVCCEISSKNHFGLPAIRSLKLLAEVEPKTLTSILGYFFPQSYEIKLKLGAQPLALYTPRNVPLPLRKQVQEDLARMGSLGVTSRVD